MFGDLFVLCEQSLNHYGPTMALCPLCGLYSGRPEHAIEHLNTKHHELGKVWQMITAADYNAGMEYVIARRATDLQVVAPKKAPIRKALDPKKVPTTMCQSCDDGAHVACKNRQCWCIQNRKHEMATEKKIKPDGCTCPVGYIGVCKVCREASRQRRITIISKKKPSPETPSTEELKKKPKSKK